MWEISPEAVITIGFVLVCAIAVGFSILFNAAFKTPPKPLSPPLTSKVLEFVQEGAAFGLTEEESLQVFREMVDDAEEPANDKAGL